MISIAGPGWHATERYWTWRFAIHRPSWVADRHWYAILGALFVGMK